MNLIDRSASYLTQAIRNNNPNAGSETALKYSLILLINTGSAILISLMLSSITGRATYALLSVSGFLILRYFSGGFTFHLRYLAVFFSSIIVTIVAHAGFQFKPYGITLCILAILILLITAPNGIQGISRIDPMYYPLLKLISILIVAADFYTIFGVSRCIFYTSGFNYSLAYYLVDLFERESGTMKARLAIIVNALLMAFAALMIGTNSIIAHRPETPMELLKK